VRSPRRALLLIALLQLPLSILALAFIPGCNIIGAAAQAAPPPIVKAAYHGMEGQSIAVMVWADRATRIDWSPIRLDLANSIQLRLQPKPRADGKPPKEAKELKGATFPVQPASIVKYQEDHPDIEGKAIADVAPKFGVTRLIYVEVEDFATRAPGAIDLYRGQASATLKIVEIDPQTQTGRIAYEENAITAVYPKNAPQDGVAGVGDAKIYVGTVKALADQITRRLISYRKEDWNDED
jgi:hypothetical protein